MSDGEVVELLKSGPGISGMIREAKSELTGILPGMSFSERLKVYEVIKTSCLKGVAARAL